MKLNAPSSAAALQFWLRLFVGGTFAIFTTIYGLVLWHDAAGASGAARVDASDPGAGARMVGGSVFVRGMPLPESAIVEPGGSRLVPVQGGDALADRPIRLIVRLPAGEGDDAVFDFMVGAAFGELRGGVDPTAVSSFSGRGLSLDRPLLLQYRGSPDRWRRQGNMLVAMGALLAATIGAISAHSIWRWRKRAVPSTTAI